MADTLTSIELKNVKIVGWNFEGQGNQFEDQGRRWFVLEFDDALGEKLHKDGWNIQYRMPSDGFTERPTLKVRVSYHRNPEIDLVTPDGTLRLAEWEVRVLDYYPHTTIDVTICPVRFSVGDRHGVTAYLQALTFNTPSVLERRQK